VSGWIKLHRKLLENPIFNNPDLLRVWIWCLLKANHTDFTQMVGLQEINLKEGQFITGRFTGSGELNINPSTFYKYLKTLEKLQMISLKSNNKMTIVTIENWRKYQFEDDESYQQNNNKVTTKEQQNNTNKNDKNDKNIFIQIKDLYMKECRSLPPIKAITQKRKQAISARIREHGQEAVYEMLKKAGRSCFLAGQNKNGWVATFDWLFKPNNFVKVLEGNYDNRDKEDLTNPEASNSNNVIDYKTASKSKYGW